MRLSTLGHTLLWAGALAWLPATGQAQELVSVRSATVNLRSAPGMQADVLWQINRGYPLQVLGREGNWLKVQDFEGDEGWVAQSVTASTPHHVVKVKSANLRAGPSAEHPVVDKVVYGQVLATALRQGEWVQVRRNNGQTAWVASDLVWGW
jgi:SH3-like domain-containing protein